MKQPTARELLDRVIAEWDGGRSPSMSATRMINAILVVLDRHIPPPERWGVYRKEGAELVEVVSFPTKEEAIEHAKELTPRIDHPSNPDILVGPSGRGTVGV